MYGAWYTLSAYPGNQRVRSWVPSLSRNAVGVAKREVAWQPLFYAADIDLDRESMPDTATRLPCRPSARSYPDPTPARRCHPMVIGLRKG